MNKTTSSKSLYPVNLPTTSFPMKGDLPRREPEILDRWEKMSIYFQLEKKNRSSRTFILHDGPPYANGHIHIGHVVNKVLKDFVIKYHMMNGEFAPFIPGWDCHGQPIEHQLMKEKKLSKHDVNVVDFRRAAAQYARKYIDIQKKEFKRLGVFGDWEHPYITMDTAYEKVIVQRFHDLLKKGFIYRKKKPVLWCAACETALADAEVEYGDHTSPSIYVSFSVIKKGKALAIGLFSALSDVRMVIWTTTPWTLPANVAIAIKPGRTYRFVKKDTGDSRYLIESRLWEEKQDMFNAMGLSVAEGDPEPVRAEELEGITCRHPFIDDRESRVVLADFVDVETGSGAVHIAPGHGEEDYLVGLRYDLPVFSPVDDRGLFTQDVPLFKGMHVFKANPLIIDLLKKRGELLKADSTLHAYPHCWRCKKPIIFRATEQWFLSMDHDNLKKRLLDTIESIEWVPHCGQARMRSMIESRPDWCLSRQRLWGSPITVIFCEGCSEPLIDERVMRSIEERIGKQGATVWFTADVNDFLYEGAVCKNCGGSRFRKEKDILDVWFDSGVSHEAVLKKDPRLSWPADLYLEGSDQHRGWFQTSMILAVALDGRAPYRAVLTHGFAVDGEGKKMSKSQGNVVVPEKIIEKYGADMLRLWVAASDYREDIRISPEILRLMIDVYRRIRNTLRFLLGNISDFSPAHDRVAYADMLEIDRWALHRLQGLNAELRSAFSLYEFHRVWKAINRFCAVDLSAVYFDILKDRLYTWPAKGQARRSAQTALLDIFLTLDKLIAPLLSFTAEEAWQVFRKEHADVSIEESVFLSPWPCVDKERVSETLEKNWNGLLSIREQVNEELERSRQAGLIRSSLEAEVVIAAGNQDTAALLRHYHDILDMICIVSKVRIDPQPQKDKPGLTVTVCRAPGEKCSRCWRLQENITAAKLCARCSDVVKEEQGL